MTLRSVAAGAVLAVAVPAFSESSWAIRSARVVDGHPLRESPRGILFAQTFSEDCRLRQRRTTTPFAGSVSTAATIELEWMTCPFESKVAPDVSCRWRISPTAPSARAESGSAGWSGLEGALPIRLPHETGVYDFSLQCEVGGDVKGEGRGFDTRLYVTYGEPLLPEPRIDWYERACEWGAGHRSEDPEHVVLTSVLSNLYAYGRQHWRYGSFPGAIPRQDPDQPDCSGEGDHSWCACSWEQLVAASSPCNFGSCYEFSDTFEAMAMTLGIGAFEPLVVKGASDAGIITSPEAVSFDHMFPRNIACRSEVEGGCPAYAFSSHSLRRRDGHIYDATFDRIYGDVGEAYFRSIKYEPTALAPRRAVLLEGSDASLRRMGHGYGTWFFYDYLAVAPPLLIPLVKLQNPGAAATPVFGPVDFEVLRDESGKRLSGVAARFELETFTEDELEVDGALMAHGKMVAHKPEWEDPRLSQSFVRGAGKHAVRLVFSGEEIFRSGVDGPYELHVNVRHPAADGPPLARSRWTTPPYANEDFGMAVIDGLTIRVPPRPPFPGEDPPLIEVSFVVRAHGSFHAMARWADGGRTIRYDVKTLKLDAGKQSFPLAFPPGDLEEVSGFKVLALSLEVLDEDWTSDVYLQCDVALLSPDPQVCQ